MMTTRIGNKEFTVKQTGNKFFYWSPRAVRWLPVKKANVHFPSPVDLSKITEALLIEACAIEDIDCALFTLQKAAGIASGDIAGRFFSDCNANEVWPPMAQADRLAWLRRYVAAENVYVD